MMTSSAKNNIIDYIGLDVLYDVLAFLDRKQLALGVEIACKLFRNIIDRTRLSQIPFLKIHSILNISHFYKLQFCKYGRLMKRHRMKICAKEGEDSCQVLWKLDKPPPYLRFENIFIIPSDFYKQPSPLATKLNPNAPTKLSLKRINALKRMGHCFENSKVHFEIPLDMLIQQQLLSNSSSNSSTPFDSNNLNLLLEIFLQIFTNCNQIQFQLHWSFCKNFIPIRYDFGLLFKNESILNCSNLCFTFKYYCWNESEHKQIELFDFEHLTNWLHSRSGKSRSLSISFGLLSESRRRPDFLEILLAILSKEMSSEIPFSYNLLIYDLPDKIQFKWREFVHQENPKTGEKLFVLLGRREYYGNFANYVRIERVTNK